MISKSLLKLEDSMFLRIHRIAMLFDFQKIIELSKFLKKNRNFMLLSDQFFYTQTNMSDQAILPYF